MINYMKAEILKIKGTTIIKTSIIIPIVGIVIAAGFCSLGGMEIMLLADVTTANHWGLIWLPAVIAVLTGLSVKQEKQSGGFKMISQHL